MPRDHREKTATQTLFFLEFMSYFDPRLDLTLTRDILGEILSALKNRPAETFQTPPRPFHAAVIGLRVSRGEVNVPFAFRR